MFASTDLARRIEAAEAKLSRDIGEAVARRRATPDGVFVRSLHAGIAVFTGVDSPITKVIGLGFDVLPSGTEMDELEDAFFARGAAVRAEVATLADPGLSAMLTARGYVLEGFENVLGRSLADVACPEVAGIEVVQTTDAPTWNQVMTDGFAHPDTGVLSAPGQVFPREALERMYDDMAATQGFARYVARVDGEAAGGASLRMCDAIAQLAGAATLSAYRRRGVQTALLNARLRDAVRAGCDVAVVTTQPGSKSQQNVQRRGFALLYTRAVLVKQPVHRAGSSGQSRRGGSAG